MKKVARSLPVTILVIVTAHLYSCKKDSDVTPDLVVKTPQELIIGKWESTYAGSDNNSNGVWDSSEKVAISGAGILYDIFKQDGSFNSYGDTVDIHSTYIFSQDSKRIIMPSRVPPLENRDTFTLDHLDGTTLIYHSSNNSYSQYLRVD